MYYAYEHLAMGRRDDLMRGAAQPRLAAQFRRSHGPRRHRAGATDNAGGLTPARATRAAIRRIRWLAVSLAAAVLTLLAGVPAALALPLPPPGGATGAQVAPSPALPAAAGGIPGWQIVLIAIGSALAASALTLLAMRVTRRPRPVRPSPS